MFEEIRLTSVTEVISRASSLLVIPLLTRALEPAGFGFYKSVFVVLSLFLTVRAMLSLDAILVKHIPERSEGERASFVAAILAVMFAVVAATVVCVLLVGRTTFFADRFPTFARWFTEFELLIVLLFFLQPTFSLGQTLSRALDRFRVYAISQVAREVAFGVAVAALYLSQEATVGKVLWTYLAVTAVGTAVMAVGLRDLYVSVPDFAALVDQLRDIALPLVPNRIVKQFEGTVPQTIVLAVFGPTVFAGWSVVFTFESVFTLLSRPFTKVLAPKLNQRVAEGEPIREHIQQYYRIMGVLAVPSVVGGGLLARDIIRFVFGGDYFLSTAIVIVVLGTLSVQIVDALGGTVYVATDKPILATYSRVAATSVQFVFVVVGAFVLQSLIVVALGYLIRNLLSLAIALWYQRTVTNVSFPRPATVGRLVASVTVLAALVALTRDLVTGVPSLVAVVTAGAGVYFTSLYVTGFVNRRDVALMRRLVGL